MTGTYAERIAGARTAYELNELADEISRVPMPADVRELLQVAFARRCREIWPRRMGRR